MALIVVFLIQLLTFCGAKIVSPVFPSTSISDDNDIDGNKQLPDNLVYPGTKWCGNGNIAEDYNDLGKFAETDACCRDHDHCGDYISAMMTKHNLTNDALYTRVRCSCDEAFHNCLHHSSDVAGKQVGVLYFSVLSTKCFRDDYPITDCKRYSKFPRRCIEYELDESKPKMYQWFDVPPY